MEQIYVMLKTVPSGSHNAPFSVELGHHWPAGSKFIRLTNRTAAISYFEQIGGEEVRLAIPTKRIGEFLRPYTEREAA